MKIHVVSTANGQENEGMRNVATHIIRELSKNNDVRTSGLKSFGSIIKNAVSCDATLFCARLNGTTYSVLKMITHLTRNVHVIAVQKPDKDFLEKNEKSPLNCSYFVLCSEDGDGIRLKPGCTVSVMEVGIDSVKFSPVSRAERLELKKEHGIPTDKPLVLHVGHCSAGRGLEDFCEIDGNRFERLIITSGMFEDEQVDRKLKDAGIKRLSGYIENVQDYYRMADAYLFPTKSGEFVISVPLSVMEALSCGTASVVYKDFEKVKNIHGAESGLQFINKLDELNEALSKAVEMKCEHSYLAEPKTWADVAGFILKKVAG